MLISAETNAALNLQEEAFFIFYSKIKSMAAIYLQ